MRYRKQYKYLGLQKALISTAPLEVHEVMDGPAVAGDHLGPYLRTHLASECVVHLVVQVLLVLVQLRAAPEFQMLLVLFFCITRASGDLVSMDIATCTR